jgi:hypothetical protein
MMIVIFFSVDNWTVGMRRTGGDETESLYQNESR